VGGAFGKAQSAEEDAVRQTMQSHHFNLFGSMRSYWDFFFGYGLIVTIVLLVLTILFWKLADFAESNAAQVRWIAGLFCLNFAAMTVISARYFFIFPAAMEGLMAVCLGVAALSFQSPGPCLIRHREPAFVFPVPCNLFSLLADC
jgi:hypothetical protein